MTVRLKDIAKLANTSEASVSLVLNGRYQNRVSPALRDRIRSIAEELDYHPNRQAQLLASGQTKTVGVLVNTLTNAFFSGYIGLLEDRLAPHGYHVLPAETRSDAKRIRGLFGMVQGRVADAVVSLSDQHDGSGSSSNARRLVFRHETFGGLRELEGGVPGVLVDYSSATGALLGQFSSQGATRLGLLMASQHDPRADHPSERAKYFLELCGDSAALPVSQISAVSEDAASECWYDAAYEMLRVDPRLDALFFHNANVAAPVLRALADHGRTVGKDIAVGTYDDPEFVRWLGPGLSVVHEPVEKVADALTAIVLSILAGERPSPYVRVLEASFTPRGSSLLG